MRWDQKAFKQISPRLFKLLSHNNDKVKIPNQLHPNIKLEQHKKENTQLSTAKYINEMPELHYRFSKDDQNGKVNVENIFKEKEKIDNYYQCLISPVDYENSELCKWTYLSEIANQFVLWKQIVLDIEKQIQPHLNFEQKKVQNQDKNKQVEDLNFDLKSALERCQINIEQAENIQTACLQPIKSQLDYEVRQKLSLYISHKLSGIITWVACIIIWYKLQKNVINIVVEELEKIKNQKQSQLNKFSQIAKGQATAVTAHCANQIFNDTFKIYNDKCLSDSRKNISVHLDSQSIKDKFDTNKVYQYLDDLYIKQANLNNYEKSISYVKNPVNTFEAYVNNLKAQNIVDFQSKENENYKNRMLQNLIAFKERLKIIQDIINKDKNMKDESINFFQIQKDGKKYFPFNDEKEEIISKMSPILLKTLKKIIDSSYVPENHQLKIPVNGVVTEYTITVKPKDSKDAKNVRESPLLNLQKLKYKERNSQELEFIQEFIKRLELSENDSKYVCTDITFMVEKLIEIVERKIEDIKASKLDNIKTNAQDNLIHTLVINAIGCNELCKFCNRKCELQPHADDNQNHNCETRGHLLRVFGGGCLVTTSGFTYPSLTTCDEINHNTKIKIQLSTGASEVRLWSEIHDAKNRLWTTNQTKFLLGTDKINPNWQNMSNILDSFWKQLGEKYCAENKYTFIEKKKLNELEQKNQLTQSSIVIICLDDSGSMFNSNNDFQKAVQGGKDVEQWLQNNHSEPSEVHIQLWFNDCYGVNRLYKGELTSTIPDNLWNRTGCQSDEEINSNVNYNYGPCGQFTGAVRILNQEVNELLKKKDYQDVYWFFFSDGGNSYPQDELNILEKTFYSNRQYWTKKDGVPKLHPLIITNQLSVQSLCQMKIQIDKIAKAIWGVQKDLTELKQNVKTDEMAEKMIEQFTFN